jgi:hypothetical protein
MRRSIMAILAVVTATATMSACSSAGVSKPAPSLTAEIPATPPRDIPATTSASPIPDTAEEIPGTKTLAYQRPTTGSSIVDRIDARIGDPLWVNVTCRDAANTTIEVAFEPLDQFTVPCTAEGFATRNQINLTSPRQLTITVTSATEAIWSLRVQQ